MKELQLLDNKVLVVQEDGLVNLRDLVKEMYPIGQETYALTNYYNSKLFLLLEQQNTDETVKTISSKFTEKLPSDRKYPSLVCKEVLQGFLMHSSSDIAARWKFHLITVLLPEYERLHALYYNDLLKAEVAVIGRDRDIQELIRTKDVMGLLEAFEFSQQAVCDLLRNTSNYEAGGYLSATKYAIHHHISLDLARFTIGATPEPMICPNSLNDGKGQLHWKSILATVVPAKHPYFSHLPPYRRRAT
jgi:hypothetical protein